MTRRRKPNALPDALRKARAAAERHQRDFWNGIERCPELWPKTTDRCVLVAGHPEKHMLNDLTFWEEHHAASVMPNSRFNHSDSYGDRWRARCSCGWYEVTTDLRRAERAVKDHLRA